MLNDEIVIGAPAEFIAGRARAGTLRDTDWRNKEHQTILRKSTPVKIALLVLPQPNETAVPPLPLAYVAALLEQQRHIVRIYDLGVRGSNPNGDPLASLRSFRPHVALIAGHDRAATLDVERRVAECGGAVLHLGLGMREWASGQEAAHALRPAEIAATPNRDEQNVIIDTLLMLDDDLDTLPFPARHLLSLEHYPIYTRARALQTPILIGHRTAGGYQLRTPALVVAELRNVAHEQAVLHVLLTGVPLTHDTVWFGELLVRLREARLGLNWAGSVDYQKLTPSLLAACRAAGCETLDVAFDAMLVLDAREARAALSDAVRQAHELGISVRARISLEPRYSSIPALVDMAGTFGLDDVQFAVQHTAHERAQEPAAEPALAEVAELVRARYQTSRSRQYFVNRFGALLGPLLWHVGRLGLLGPAMRQHAVGMRVGGEVGVAEG